MMIMMKIVAGDEIAWSYVLFYSSTSSEWPTLRSFQVCSCCHLSSLNTRFVSVLESINQSILFFCNYIMNTVANRKKLHHPLHFCLHIFYIKYTQVRGHLRHNHTQLFMVLTDDSTLANFRFV